MQCEIQSMTEKGRAKNAPSDDTVPPEGFVQQVCQGWLVHEDSALAHKLQKEEIEMHYGKNRSERKVVREDLKCARNMQEEEDEEATNVQRMYEELLIEQEKIDEELAMQLQRNEQTEVEKLHHFNEADEELARHLQEKEKHRYEKKKREKVILKEIKQVEKVRAQCTTEQGIPSEEKQTSRNANDITTPIFAGEFNGFDGDLSDFCIKPTPEMDDVSVRKLQEEQDAELARLLQEQETKRSGYSDRDRLMAIEAQDRELARVLQEQERARAKRAKERARQKAMKKQSDQLNSEDGIQAPVSYLPMDHCSDLTPASDEKIGKMHMTNTPTTSLKKSSGLVRPTQLDISSTIYSGISDDDDSRQNATHHGGGNVYAQVASSSSSNQQKTEAPVPNHSVNIAMAIDPTYSRRQHSSIVDVVPNENNGSNGSTPILPSPISIRTGTYNGDDYYYDSDEGPAPPYMPIQGQRRNSSLEKKKKARGGKEGCKQQ